ncbi:MAG: hypothetical protein KKE30_11730 [Gammaproteobacteria bacterium]|nr:hypothetical protein [Gammaproteobacteria bacterium]MBU1553537.1 hypothetical protein [Gammaproteobacteria bacterium]MBU2071654.1 hypothetical protein [Gammaproteobacteria bacterium]MBU2204010.1 hypothetical protein [Gammaproteobacteria bacterium]
MYQEVSLDPHCLSEFHYYGLLKSNFGYEAGRYAVAPLRDWIKEAYQAAKSAEDLGPVKKKSITNFLNSLLKDKSQDKIIMPRYRSHISAVDWLDWLEHQRALRPFNSVISERVGSALSYEEIIAGHQCWVIPPTKRVDKTAESIVEVFSSLLRIGGNLVIIDQYFSLASNPVLKAIFNFLQTNQNVLSITLVTSIDAADPAAVFEREYKEEYAFIPKFNLVIVPSKFFHDRYFFTEYGALKSGQGFIVGAALGAQADKLSINLCGKDECLDAHSWVKQVIADGRVSLKVLS